MAIKADQALGALARVQAVHAIQGAQQRRFAATRGADKGRDLALDDVEVDGFQGMKAAVVKVEVAHLDGVAWLDRGFRHIRISSLQKDLI
ncbi:hypothetical protein [Serpentinimonas maccroryi]|uniref:hypothetical protein n=1 Tax=Serpentinimonas maccroryi TaxID=1458426 RepID=UPI0011DDCEDB|nr:hypothetical protein [Serpentinimonas maccroryi]